MDNLHKINSISFTKLREERKLAKLIQYFRIKCRGWFLPDTLYQWFMFISHPMTHLAATSSLCKGEQEKDGAGLLSWRSHRRVLRVPWMEAAQLFREQQAALSLPNWTSVGTSTAGAATGSHNSPSHRGLGNPIFPSVPSTANGSSCLLMGVCQSSLFLPAATFTPKLELI